MFVSIHLFFYVIVAPLYDRFRHGYHVQMMFTILLDVYLLEFLLWHLNMLTSKTAVVMYNITQIVKKQQFFSICDSKLFFFQIGVGTFLLRF